MKILATNITSPLGNTTEENYLAVRSGMTGVAHHAAGTRCVPFDIEASLFSVEPDFEALCLASACEALCHTTIDPSRTIFILSSTKARLDEPMGETARKIALKLGIENEPVVVSNACASGIAAQILALRLIDAGTYDYAVITGADVQSKFIISGFQSLKALSPQPCRPFDIERLGLNLGEAAATMVVGRDNDGNNLNHSWHVTAGAIYNDAWHISGPHPKGDGAYRVLTQMLSEAEQEDIACIGVHGTATMYNDQMESVAIERAGLSAVPLSALKGYYGHTMGAAGLLETILTARALDDGIILASKGFSEPGVSGKVNISANERKTDKHAFIKMISGFGGVNAAVMVEKTHTPTRKEKTPMFTPCDTGRNHAVNTGRRMDALSRAAVKASEDINFPAADVILFNQNASTVTDKAFMQTIKDDEYFPSPSLFIYTLPNIAAGEIAIRHGWQTETSFYVLRNRNEKLMRQIIQATLSDTHRGNIPLVSGWVDNEKEKLKIYGQTD